MDSIRRGILKASLAMPLCQIPALGLAARGNLDSPAQLFDISLAQWSVHRSIFGESLSADFRQVFAEDPDSVLRGDLHPLDFPVLAREQFGIDAVEYVNTFFYGHAEDIPYLETLRANAASVDVRSQLIMCDALGAMGTADEAERSRIVDRHKPWVDAAAFLGCHAVRVNAYGTGSPDDQAARVADGLTSLAEYAWRQNISVLVENHGGLSSNGEWLAAVMKRSGHPGIGTLPDFGNFRVSEDEYYDPYRGVTEMMPFAKAVSAKSYDFDDEGNEKTIDYPRMMRIVLDAGYRGHVGIEYEGGNLSEFDGIRATQRLLERVRTSLSQEFTATA